MVRERSYTNSKKGRGWHKDSAGHAQVGQIGGKATAKTHGVQFYHEIGRLGGRRTAQEYKDTGFYQAIGYKGGKSKSKKR